MRRSTGTPSVAPTTMSEPRHWATGTTFVATTTLTGSSRVEHIDLMAEAKTLAEAFRLSQRLIGGELEFDDLPEVIEASDDAT